MGNNVDITQLVECQTSNLDAVGSSPIIHSNNQHAYGNKSKRTKLVFVKNKILFFELNLFYCWSFKMDLMFLVKLETISEKS